MHLGLGLSICSARGGASVFDPATLSLTGWWRGSFAASPWVGTASAGGSGSQNLTEASNPPSVGSAVNGYAPADFDGTNDKLSGAACSTFMTTSAFSGWALVWVDSIATDDAGTDSSVNDCIMCTMGTGQWWIFLRSSGRVGMGFLENGFGIRNVSTSGFTTGAWQLVQFRHTGMAAQIRINGGTWASTAVGPGTINSLAAALNFSRNPSFGQFLDFMALDIGLTTSVLTDTNFDSILSYARARYGLALT